MCRFFVYNRINSCQVRINGKKVVILRRKKQIISTISHNIQMNITLEKITDVTAKLILKVEEADYAANMEKSLKNMRQKANMPGFRKGMVPMTLVRKMYGDSVKYEEVNSFCCKDNTKLYQREPRAYFVRPDGK